MCIMHCIQAGGGSLIDKFKRGFGLQISSVCTRSLYLWPGNKTTYVYIRYVHGIPTNCKLAKDFDPLSILSLYILYAATYRALSQFNIGEQRVQLVH